MFNSNSTSREQAEQAFIPVLVTLVSGEKLKGAIAIRKNSRLGDLLNSSDKYVLFKTNAGEPVYLAQSTIAIVQSNEKPSARQLEISMKKFDETNPYKILRVKPGAGKAEIKTAYHELVKYYHPDQFSNTPLPKEVRSYLHSVVLRLNASYQELIDETDREERLKQARAAAQHQPAQDSPIRYFGQ